MIIKTCRIRGIPGYLDCIDYLGDDDSSPGILVLHKEVVMGLFQQNLIEYYPKAPLDELIQLGYTYAWFYDFGWFVEELINPHPTTVRAVGKKFIFY